MTNQEKELFMAVPSNEFNTYWIPCTWFVFRLQEASKKGKLINNYALETLMRVSKKRRHIRQRPGRILPPLKSVFCFASRSRELSAL